MRYLIYLILIILIPLKSGDVLAQDDRYRVEVIVLTHLHHAEEPREIKWLEDLSSATDFLTPPREPSEAEILAEILVESSMIPPGGKIPEEYRSEQDDANKVVHIEEMSPVMQESWRRMRLSAPFRPEQYLSWEQGSEAPFPVLRVHDLEPVMIDDPYFELRVAMAEAAAELAEQAIEDGETIDAYEETGEEDLLPEPTTYYRLDGTVVLRRTRFLHLDLDLQLREAVFEETETPDPPLPSYDEDIAAEILPPPRPSSFLVFNLTQSRQVKTGRMEYFDSPVVGLLAYISRIEPEQAEDSEQP